MWFSVMSINWRSVTSRPPKALTFLSRSASDMPAAMLLTFSTLFLRTSMTFGLSLVDFFMIGLIHSGGSMPLYVWIWYFAPADYPYTSPTYRHQGSYRQAYVD